MANDFLCCCLCWRAGRQVYFDASPLLLFLLLLLMLLLLLLAGSPATSSSSLLPPSRPNYPPFRTHTPCQRQKSGPKGVKADEDADVCADTTTVANTTTTTAAPIVTTTNTDAAATTADPDPALRKSPAKRALVPSPSSKALGPRQKKQATTQQKPPTTAAAVGLLTLSASLAKGQLPPTNKAGSCSGGGGAASAGVSVNTNATVSVSAATLPPATPKPSPTSSITPPPRVKPKTPAGKEPRPAHQRQNRAKQQHRQRASSSTSASPLKLLSAASPPTGRARAGAGAGVVSPTPTPSPPRRRTTPQFNSTAAAKIAALPPLMPCGENINMSAASSTAAAASRSPYPSLIGFDSGSLGFRGMGVGGVGGLPSMPPAPPLSDSASSGEGSSRWGSVSEMFVASPEDEMVWSGDEFSGDGGGGGGGLRDDEDYHLGDGVGGSRGGFFSDLPLAFAMSGGRSGVAACRDMGKGQFPVPQPRPCSPIMVSPGRQAGGGWGGGGGPDLKPTAFGGGRAHDGSHAVRTAEGRGVGSPINSWTPEFAEAALVRVFSEAECALPPPGVGGGGGIGGAGAGVVAGAAGVGLHPHDKRQFLPWPPLSQQQQQQQSRHHAYANQDGFSGASFANTGGLLPPLASPSSSSSVERFWNHGTGQQRGDARNFPDVTTVTTSLDAAPWTWGTHPAAIGPNW